MVVISSSALEDFSKQPCQDLETGISWPKIHTRKGIMNAMLFSTAMTLIVQLVLVVRNAAYLSAWSSGDAMDCAGNCQMRSTVAQSRPQYLN